MPIDYSRYPSNWFEIRAVILNRAGNRCERCELPNYAYGTRDARGVFHHWPPDKPVEAIKLTRIILTIAHLDHDITNNDPANLQALCQRCHLLHDARHHALNSARTRRRHKLEAGQIELLTLDT